jgi:cytochrome c-type biogenesis protein CcmH/NrfG
MSFFTLLFAAAFADVSMPVVPSDPFALPERGKCAPIGEAHDASVDQANRGDDAMIAGDLERAFGHWRLAVTLDGCNAEAWSNMGSTLIGLGLADRAVSALDTATQLSAHSSRIWTELGRAYEAALAFDLAIGAFQSALLLRVDNREAASGLARVARSGLR